MLHPTPIETDTDRINVTVNYTTGLDLDKVHFYLNRYDVTPVINDEHKLVIYEYGGKPDEDPSEGVDCALFVGQFS